MEAGPGLQPASMRALVPRLPCRMRCRHWLRSAACALHGSPFAGSTRSVAPPLLNRLGPGSLSEVDRRKVSEFLCRAASSVFPQQETAPTAVSGPAKVMEHSNGTRPGAPSFQEAMRRLQEYWVGFGCAVFLPHNTEVCPNTVP